MQNKNHTETIELSWCSIPPIPLWTLRLPLPLPPPALPTAPFFRSTTLLSESVISRMFFFHFQIESCEAMASRGVVLRCAVTAHLKLLQAFKLQPKRPNTRWVLAEVFSSFTAKIFTFPPFWTFCGSKLLTYGNKSDQEIDVIMHQKGWKWHSLNRFS